MTKKIYQVHGVLGSITDCESVGRGSTPLDLTNSPPEDRIAGPMLSRKSISYGGMDVKVASLPVKEFERERYPYITPTICYTPPERITSSGLPGVPVAGNL